MSLKGPQLFPQGHWVLIEHHLLSSVLSESDLILTPLYWAIESLLTEIFASWWQCIARWWSGAVKRLGLRSVGCSMLRSVGSKSSSMGESPSSTSGSTLILTATGGVTWCCCCCCTEGAGLVGLICWRRSDMFFILFSSLGLRRNLEERKALLTWDINNMNPAGSAVMETPTFQIWLTSSYVEHAPSADWRLIARVRPIITVFTCITASAIWQLLENPFAVLCQSVHNFFMKATPKTEWKSES